RSEYGSLRSRRHTLTHRADGLFVGCPPETTFKMKILIAAFALCAFFECSVRVFSQTSSVFPLTSSVLMTNSTATLSGVTIQVRPSQLEKGGILIMPMFSAAGAGTSNVVFTFNLSPDGVTYSTTGPVIVTAACNGT